MTPPLSDLLPEIYRRLYGAYGPQGWWPAESAFEVVIGAILTQSTSWVNVEKALSALRGAELWSFEAIAAATEGRVAEIIRSSGYYNAKARKLRAFAAHVMARGGLDALLAQDTAPLRQELLSIHGIGPETADDILVYAAGKPSFVIDAYTRRIVDRLGIAPGGRNPGYDAYQALFQENLPPDPGLFNEFHALLDHHAKITCQKTRPRCRGCPLSDLCTAAVGVLEYPSAMLETAPDEDSPIPPREAADDHQTAASPDRRPDPAASARPAPGDR